MKTIQKPLAFLFAVLTFAACTDRTIEPVGPAQRPQPAITRLDTVPMQPKVAGYSQLQSLEETDKPNSLLGCGTTHPAPVSNPRVIDTPRQTVMLDSLAY